MGQKVVCRAGNADYSVAIGEKRREILECVSRTQKAGENDEWCARASPIDDVKPHAGGNSD
jgi:hypothetical protein